MQRFPSLLRHTWMFCNFRIKILYIFADISRQRPLAITFSSGSNTNNNSNGNITLSDRIIQYFEATTFLLLLLLCSLVESRLSRGVPEVQGVSEKMFFFLKKVYASFPLLAGKGLWLVVDCTLYRSLAVDPTAQEEEVADCKKEHFSLNTV